MIDPKMTEFLDTLEDFLIKQAMPMMRVVQKEVPELADKDLYTMTRTIIGKIGLRISFGKEIADQMIMGKKENKP